MPKCSTVYHLFIFTLAFSALQIACTTPQSSLADEENYTAGDDQYRHRYDVKFDENEKPIRFGYYFIVSKVPTGYRVRVFHPEKKTMTEDKNYSTPSLTLLHGVYKSWWDDGSLREQGVYQYGRKHGQWVEHEPYGGKSSSGEYVNNRKEGAWTQLDSSGILESTYTYQDGKRNGKYYLYDLAGQKTNEGLYKSDTLITELHKLSKTELPFLKSCSSAPVTDVHACTEGTLHQYIYNTLSYPSGAKHLEIQGSAFAVWDVMPDGSVKNIRIPQALSNDIEAECLKVLNHMPQWEPARKDDIPVKWTMSLPINFKL